MMPCRVRPLVNPAVLIVGFAVFTAAALLFSGSAVAQTPGRTSSASPNGATVAWSAPLIIAASGRKGQRVALIVQGAVREGWHVYALRQQPNGPTPLKVTLEANPVVTADGSPVGSPATIAHDPAFNLDTPYYSRSFKVKLPVRLASNMPVSHQSIPVSVRFQTCNGQTCEPPKTIHLSAPVEIGSDR
jgi:DsbC/DsbD-like thiol-disulfide interchange protein